LLDGFRTAIDDGGGVPGVLGFAGASMPTLGIID